MAAKPAKKRKLVMSHGGENNNPFQLRIGAISKRKGNVSER